MRKANEILLAVFGLATAPIFLLSALFVFVALLFSGDDPNTTSIEILSGLAFYVFVTLLYALPWVCSFFLYLKSWYKTSICIAIIGIFIIGAPSAYAVSHYISLKQPPQGLLTPTSSFFPAPFSDADMRQYMDTSYQIDNYDPANPQSDLNFSDTEDSQSYDLSQQVVQDGGVVSYTSNFDGMPGVVYTDSKGRGYELFWHDDSQYITISYSGPLSGMTPQQLSALLGTMHQPSATSSNIFSPYLDLGQAMCSKLPVDLCVI